MKGEAEEDAMETKSLVRSTPSGADSKRTENGSKYSKYNRKREGNGTSRPKNDPQPRKPGPKARGYDKRPQSRGYANASPRPQVTEAPEVEFGSALQTGSKKGNLNHLLNFTLAPREGAGGRGSSWINRNNWGGKKSVKYNKENYLQANCQFVVRETGDYTVHAADPDVLVDWDLIEQVRIQSHEVPNCPICLFPPVAAKLTRCGHIYCWTCMLHYLALGEKTWRKCPICYESVHKKDLKSVIATKTDPYSAGDQITMVLMKRERGTTYAMPKSQWQARDAKPHAVNDDVDTRFAKLLSASVEHVQKIIDDEKRAILQQIEEEGGTESIEGSFSKAALELLKEREKNLEISALVKSEIDQLAKGSCDFAAEGEIRSRNPSSASLASVPGNYESEEENCSFAQSASAQQVEIQYASAFDDEICLPGEPLPVTPEESDIQDSVTDDCSQETESPEAAAAMANMSLISQDDEHTKSPGSSRMTNVYYFYQAEDGQHIYLNSLNARCLIKEYGSLENSPETITATIVNKESISMTEDLRRRVKYLNHLPLTCEYQIVELALKPPIISGGTIRAFAAEIEHRRKMRQKKQRQEKKVDRRMKHNQDMKAGKYPAMRAPLTSTQHFPICGTSEGATEHVERPISPASDVSTPLGSPPAVNLNPYAMEFTPGSPFTPSSLDNGNQTATVSFAQMLREGQRKPPEVWQKANPWQDQPKVVHVKKPGSDESDSEDRVPIPEFQDSFGIAIQQALDNFSNHAETESGEKGRKKKKKQKKLLFVTTMARK